MKRRMQARFPAAALAGVFLLGGCGEKNMLTNYEDLPKI